MNRPIVLLLMAVLVIGAVGILIAFGGDDCPLTEHVDYGGSPYFDTPEDALAYVVEEDVAPHAASDAYRKEARGRHSVRFRADDHYFEFYRDDAGWAFGSRTGCA